MRYFHIKIAGHYFPAPFSVGILWYNLHRRCITVAYNRTTLVKNRCRKRRTRNERKRERKKEGSRNKHPSEKHEREANIESSDI